MLRFAWCRTSLMTGRIGLTSTSRPWGEWVDRICFIKALSSDAENDIVPNLPMSMLLCCCIFVAFDIVPNLTMSMLFCWFVACANLVNIFLGWIRLKRQGEDILFASWDREDGILDCVGFHLCKWELFIRMRSRNKACPNVPCLPRRNYSVVRKPWAQPQSGRSGLLQN